MAEADALQQKLERAQNADGGWGFQASNSWTEPTALALLALKARAEKSSAAYRPACEWLIRNQRRDGGWPPRPGIDQSTWVTSLATLALSEDAPQENSRRAADWIVAHLDQGPSHLMRFIARLKNTPKQPSALGGSPWFPGTAAWVAPTVTGILALSGFIAKTSDRSLQHHVTDGQRFLLSRRCRDQGWNHGGSSFRSEKAESYPEMTGMALTALDSNTPVPDSTATLEQSLACAESLLSRPESIEGLSWLQLGFFRHGRDVSNLKTTLLCRTTRDMSLRLLALSAASKSNKFLIPLSVS